VTMTFDPDLERRVIALFQQAVDVPQADLREWVETQTRGDPMLKTRLVAMLRANDLAVLRTGGVTDIIEDERQPERIGAYRIIEQIGRGGMGTVYRGERATGDFTHSAAIKLIKPGLLSEKLVERFQRERQTLASLEHPNIARLYDGGETAEGAPYIIMEYVDGQRLLDWSAQQSLSLTARLGLFEDVCEAVAFAHRNLIVHRDITPSNVLVTRDGKVKLIDFGIAKPATDTTLDASVLRGSSTASLSLTPGYAAPERMAGAEATTSADIYSLGKLLSALVHPDVPSGELAAIIDTATASLPTERYQTADALRDDIIALQQDMPVVAMKGGKRYGLRKFVARHKLGVFATMSALAVLLMSLAGLLLALNRAEKARAGEVQRFEQLRSLAKYQLFELNDTLRLVPGNTTARASLAGVAQKYLTSLAATPDASRAVRMDTARGLIRLAEIQNSPLDRNLGLTLEAKASLAAALTQLAGTRATFGDAADITQEEARVIAFQAMLALHEDRNPESANPLLAKAIKTIASVPLAARTDSWHLARRDISRVALEHYALDEQLEALTAAASVHEKLVAAWPASVRKSQDADIEQAYVDYARGVYASMSGKPGEGLTEFVTALRVFRAAESRRRNDPQLLYMIGWTGLEAFAAAAQSKKPDLSNEMILSAKAAIDRLVVVTDKDESARVLNKTLGESLAQHLSNLGRHTEAVAAQRKVVDDEWTWIEGKTDGRTGGDLAYNETILGLIAKQAGNRALACESWQKADSHFTPVEKAGNLVGFYKAFLPGLRANLKVCRNGGPISAFVPLR
jgi:eukaryotic-like serine/threonine-protein kinase